MKKNSQVDHPVNLVGDVVTGYSSLRKENKKTPGCLDEAKKCCQQKFRNPN